jgi:hypothetical protein
VTLLETDLATGANRNRGRLQHLRPELWLVVLAVAAALLIRAAHLDANPFWVDEAESSINALTVLQTGYPTDRYLGLPIYENTLIRPWPEHPEYEFKDTSYSDKHMAVYHGWLPLYCIAASFALHHIDADKPPALLKIKHNPEERRRRTAAARVPSVLFGALLLVFAFFGGRALYGRDAGWAALLVGAIYPWHINLSRQARYYSATMALATGCCVLLWLMIEKGKWKHFLWGALLFVLLFHTHLLSFFSAFVVVIVTLPLVIGRHQSGALKAGVFGLIVVAGSLPWILITGFHKHQAAIPRGWSLLSLPADLFRFPPITLGYLIAGIMFGLPVLCAVLARPGLLTRVKSPLLHCWRPLLFLCVWIASGYVSFLLFMPAASFFVERLTLSFWGAALLAAAIMCACTARIVAGRFSILVAPAIFLFISLVTGHRLDLAVRYSTAGWSNLDLLIQRLGFLDLKEGAKLYAVPNEHLVLAFYTGLPFQSVAPVRKVFLDRYEGDIVLVDRFELYSGPSSQELQKAAAGASQSLSREQAEDLSALLRSRAYRETANWNATGMMEALPDLVPPFAEPLVPRYQAVDRAKWHWFMNKELITRGFDAENWCDWRRVFFYRFVDPESRRGAKLNYAERLRGANALLCTDSGWAIYHSPGKSGQSAAGVTFSIVR